MHQSIYRRFEAGSVPLYDRTAAYRPDNMMVHVDFKRYFDGSGAAAPMDDIEQTWENAGYVGGSDPDSALKSGSVGRPSSRLRLRPAEQSRSQCREWISRSTAKITV